MLRAITLIALTFVLTSTPLSAQGNKEKADTAESSTHKPIQIVTHHTITIDGQQIKYTATTGTMLLRDENNKPTSPTS